MSIERIGECLARGVQLLPHLIVLGVVLLLLPIVLPIFIFIVALGWIAEVADEWGILSNTVVKNVDDEEGEDE